MNRLQEARNSVSFQRLYTLSIIIKGIDGLIELCAGILLLTAPNILHNVLSNIAGHESISHNHMMRIIAENIARIDSDLTKGGLVIVIIFLISHGMIKLLLVYALLKKLLWAYPYALTVLGGFLVYQIYLCATKPSIGMILFALLDAIIVWVVWAEWKKLKSDHAQQSTV